MVRRRARERRPGLWGWRPGWPPTGCGQLLLFPLAEVDPVAWLLAGLLVGATARREELVAPHLPAAGRLVGPVVAGGLAAGRGLRSGVGRRRRARADRLARQALDEVAEGRGEAGARSAARAVAQRPDVLRYRLVAAEALSARGSAAAVRDALTQVAAARRTSPGDPVVRARAAALRSRLADVTGDPDDARAAEEAWAGVVAADPVNAGHRLAWGVALVRVERPAGAEVQWRRAEDLAPRSPEPSIDLAQLYLRTGRVDEARAAAARALARAPDDPRPRAPWPRWPPPARRRPGRCDDPRPPSRPEGTRRAPRASACREHRSRPARRHGTGRPASGGDGPAASTTSTS